MVPKILPYIPIIAHGEYPPPLIRELLYWGNKRYVIPLGQPRGQENKILLELHRVSDSNPARVARKVLALFTLILPLIAGIRLLIHAAKVGRFYTLIPMENKIEELKNMILPTEPPSSEPLFEKKAPLVKKEREKSKRQPPQEPPRSDLSHVFTNPSDETEEHMNEQGPPPLSPPPLPPRLNEPTPPLPPKLNEPPTPLPPRLNEPTPPLSPENDPIDEKKLFEGLAKESDPKKRGELLDKHLPVLENFIRSEDFIGVEKRRILFESLATQIKECKTEKEIGEKRISPLIEKIIQQLALEDTAVDLFYDFIERCFDKKKLFWRHHIAARFLRYATPEKMRRVLENQELAKMTKSWRMGLNAYLSKKKFQRYHMQMFRVLKPVWEGKIQDIRSEAKKNVWLLVFVEVENIQPENIEAQKTPDLGSNKKIQGPKGNLKKSSFRRNNFSEKWEAWKKEGVEKEVLLLIGHYLDVEIVKEFLAIDNIRKSYLTHFFQALLSCRENNPDEGEERIRTICQYFWEDCFTKEIELSDGMRGLIRADKAAFTFSPTISEEKKNEVRKFLLDPTLS